MGFQSEYLTKQVTFKNINNEEKIFVLFRVNNTDV